MKTCKRCGKSEDAKPFAFKGDNKWIAESGLGMEVGMHYGCAKQQAVEQAVQDGGAALKTPEGEPTPPLTDKQKANQGGNGG